MIQKRIRNWTTESVAQTYDCQQNCQTISEKGWQLIQILDSKNKSRLTMIAVFVWIVPGLWFRPFQNDGPSPVIGDQLNLWKRESGSKHPTTSFNPYNFWNSWRYTVTAQLHFSVKKYRNKSTTSSTGPVLVELSYFSSGRTSFR